VHRDLKPENIIIAADGRIKIIEFGLALSRAARRVTWTRLSTTFGTPDYMAPEQLGGRRGDGRADVYALGTILFEMLTGKLPFEGPHAAAILRAKTSELARLPSYYVPDFDPCIEAIIMHAIERLPRDRYPSAAALLQDLRNPSAAAARQVETDAKPWRRRRRYVMPLVIATVLAGLSSLIWLSAHRPH